MPIEHSPKNKNDDLPAVFKSPLQYASDSNNSEQPEYESGSSASLRVRVTQNKTRKTNVPKRKRNETDDVSNADVIDMFKKLSEDQDAKFSALLQSNTELKTSIDFMSQKYDEVITKMHAIEDANKKLANRVQFLESQLEIQNRNARCTSVEIRSVPQTQKETKSELKEIIIKTAEFLKIPVTNTEIKDVYRVNTKAAIKPIIADFTTVSTRDHFIASFKKYNKEHRGDQFNSANIRIPGPSKPIYISENLTPKDRRLYYLAREFAAGNGYPYCWVSYGKIYLRKSEGLPPIKVTCEEDLAKLRNK